ncbi:MAG: PIN domain-containing protein [Verrucomicrobiota bacterium]
MSWLVDTDVLSEPLPSKPNLQVVQWLGANQSSLYTSAVTVAELRLGIAQLAPGRRQQQLQAWLENVLTTMQGRVLSCNVRAALVWGDFYAELIQTGRKMPFRDSFIAAIARRHHLTIVTRNTEDFNRPGLRVFNPFGELRIP